MISRTDSSDLSSLETKLLGSILLFSPAIHVEIKKITRFDGDDGADSVGIDAILEGAVRLSSHASSKSSKIWSISTADPLELIDHLKTRIDMIST